MEERRRHSESEGAAACYSPDEVSQNQVVGVVGSSVAFLRDISPEVSGNNNIVIKNCQINIDITNVGGSRRVTDTQVVAISSNVHPRNQDDWYFTPFAVLKLKLCDKLGQDDIMKLAQHFRLESLVAERKDLSAVKFLEILEHRKLFSAREVDRLFEGLLTIEDGALFAIVAEYQNNCVAISDITDRPVSIPPGGVPRIRAISSSEMEVSSHLPIDDNQDGDNMSREAVASNDFPDTSSWPTIRFPIDGHQGPLCGLQLIISSDEEESTARLCRSLEKDLKDIVWAASGCLDHLTNVFFLLLNSYGPLVEISDTDGIKFHLGVDSISCLESLQEDVTDGSLANELMELLLPDKMNSEMEKHQINMSVKLDPDSLQKLHSYLISQNNDDENGDGLQGLEFFCDYCKVFFEEEWQHDYHIDSDDHKKKIATKQGNEVWREREPPLTATNGNFKYCENVVDKSCEYMGTFGMENKCPYAHTSRELKEWKKRHQHRLKIIQRLSDQSENLFQFRSSKKGQAKESKRWTDLISRINAEVDTLKSVGSIKYSKKEKIGTGSSGSHIFGGKFGNRDVAVKKIMTENVQREKELYDLMKSKDMRNILKILHVEEDEDFTYIVTKLCEYDLKAVIEDEKNPVRESLTPEKRVKLCVDILRGLKDLHFIDVIHRDLKPNNILVDVDGEAFVADFGISRNLVGATTHVTSCYGTLCWIAYESSQSKNDKVRYKKESDVQVAGCLIYYILSNGHHPFEATSPFINDTAKLMSNVAEGKFSLLHVENYPDQCTALLKRMLDQDMLKRPRIDDCLKEMEAVRKSYISSTNKNTLTNDDITLSMKGVSVKCNSDFGKYLPGKNQRKKQKTRWALHVKCTTIQLAKIYLWHSQSENFCLSHDGQSRQQELEVKDIRKDSEGTYIIFVDFESTTRGAFHQWLILDFGFGKALCQQFLVWVGPKFAVHFQTGDDSTLWDLSNHEVVKFPCSFEPDPLYEKLEEKYPLPEATSGFPTSQQLTRDNFQEYFHEMVFDEERARIKLLKQFNGFQEMDLKERIDEKLWVKPPTGQLFGEIRWKVRLDDSEASQIVTRSVPHALLKFESSPETVYVAEIVAGLRLDLREVDRFVVSLSPQCVEDQKLKPGVKVSVNVQFKVDRKIFCFYHYSIDNLRTKHLLFPPRDMFPRFLEEDSISRHKDYSLNHRQEETRKFISRAKDAVPFHPGPSLIIGPFGTGKTLTLARTVVDILEVDQESKFLICTHSNSAADLFISELLGGCKQKPEFGLLRVYATERDPVTVEEVIRERFSNFDFIGNKFVKPSAEDVSHCHVVVTTLATSIHFIDPPRLRGMFTYIFIDEAGQALETETMIPLGLAGPRTVVVLAGDHKQMRPKIFSRKAQKCNFQRSMLERLFYWSKRSNCNNFHFLTDNYRILSPEILAFIGEHCYHVKNFATAKSKDQQQASTTSTSPSMVFSAVSGEDKLEKISYYNEKEVDEIVQQVLKLKTNWPSEWGDFTEQSIAVLSPYKLQVQLLRRSFRKKFLHSINVHTVQNSQGQQFKVVFISTVRTRQTICKDEMSSPSLLRHDPDYYGVLSDEGELITALTRARSLLWVVGDPISLCSVGKCQKIWKEYIQACERMGSLKPSDVSWPAIEEELAALMCASPPIEEEDESNVNTDNTLYSRLTAEHIEPLHSTSSQDCDTDTEFEDIDDVIFDEIISELEKEVEKELSRSDSASAVEPEDTPQEESGQEFVSGPQAPKPGRKKRRFKFRMLQEDEISLVKIDYNYDHSNLEGGYDSEVDEEPEEMDEAKKAQNIQLTIDCPDDYCTAVLQFAENNLVHAIPLESHSHDKIVISSKRKRRRALDGDQVVLRKWTIQNVTYGEVMCILKRAEDLKWKKIVCTLDSENLGLMCPVDNSFLPKMFIYPRGIKKTGSESAVTIGLYSINPHQRRKIQHKKNVVVKSTEMANKLFVVQYLKWFDDCPYPMGIVTEELPACDSLDVGLRVLRLKHGVREKWPASAMEDTKQYTEKWKIPKSELKKRAEHDFRGKCVFTIGRSDLSDRDFAIHLEELQDGKIELGLHLADVPFFVGKDSSLDREVLRRGSSFFTTFRNSSHMLPDMLSTNLCMFEQNKERLSVSIVLTLDKSVQVDNVVFCRSVVCCQQNLTFEEVENYILNKNVNPNFDFKREVIQQVELLYKVMNFLPPLSQILQGAEIEDQINFPLAYGLVEGIRKLANVQVTKKLKSLSEYKIPVCHQLPPKKEDSRLWYQTFEEDAHRIPHLPASLFSEEKRVSYKQPIPVLQPIWEELGQILDCGKDQMLELQKLLSCNEGFPRRVSALANLNDITPQEEYTCMSAGSGSQLGLQHFSKQEDFVHPFMAPVRSFMDLVVLRMLVASIEKTENPYSNNDVSHIAYHCTKQTQSAKKYKKKAEMLVFAFKAKMTPHQLQAVIHSATEEGLVFCYPFFGFLKKLKSSTNVPLHLLKPGQRPEVGAVEGKSLQLNWKNRIYSYEGQMPEVIDNKSKFWLFTNKHVKNIPAPPYEMMFQSVEEKVHQSLENLEIDWNQINQRNTDRSFVPTGGELVYDVTCEKMKTERGSSEIRKYVQFNRQFNPGDVVELQLSSGTEQGLLVPRIQLFKMTPKYDFCLEHRSLPVSCFTEMAEKMPLRCDTIEEYVETWLPMLRMMVAYNTIMSDETILIQDVTVKWSEEKLAASTEIYGHFSLEKKWCDDRQIMFSTFPKKKKHTVPGFLDPTEKFLLSDFICVRVNGRKVKEDQLSQLLKLGSKQNVSLKTEVPIPKTSTIVVHGVSGATNIGKPAETENYEIEFQVTKTSSPTNCLFDEKAEQNQDVCTVELIPKPEPEKRMEVALANVKNSSDLIRSIVLQSPEDIANSVEDRVLNRLIEEGRKIEDKSFRDFFEQQPPNESQTEALKKALTHPFTVIQGPPGTGKTRTGAYLTTFFAQINRKVFKKARPQILYCGPSNKSVDVIALYLQKFQKRKLRFVRVYSDSIEQQTFPIPGIESAERKFTYVEDAHMAKEIKEHALHHIIRSSEAGRNGTIIRGMDRQIAQGKLEPSQENVRRYKEIIRNAKIAMLKGRDIILCTCNAAGHFILMENLNIVQCIIDEAGMCFELDSLIPLVCQHPKQIVLIGDHKQLRPIIQNPRAKQLGAEISLMEKFKGEAYTLKIQYRMHEEICKFPSQEFYDDQLITDESVRRRQNYLARHVWPGQGHPHVFCHIEGEEDTQTVRTSDGNELSKSNRKEASEVVSIAKCLIEKLRVHEDNLVILSQYNLQCKLIRDMLKESRVNVKVQTIIKSQGSEWDFVLLSTVRSLPEDEIPRDAGKSWRRKNLGFIEDENQMNVGLTRAMRGLIIVGNKNLLVTCNKWKKLIQHYQTTKSVVPAESFLSRYR